MGNTKITKAVIPCAGLGTRFLPITKSLPKELLPVIDTPVLQFIIDEVADSGITDVLIVINESKQAIKHYFCDHGIVELLSEQGKIDQALQLKKITDRVNFNFEYQNTPKGSGDAVMYAKKFVGNQPFALAWGDDLILGDTPTTLQLISAYQHHGTSILGVQKILNDDIVKYGVLSVSEQVGKSYKCIRMVEKPSIAQIPSRLAALGRYILTVDIFEEICQSKVHASGELHLTSALNALGEKGKLWAYEFDGVRFDMGDKLGSLKAAVSLGIKRFGDEFSEYLKSLLKTV
ncbi:MAG: UTP--glucose-1-phosphate uridylyltransferase [Clostridiales bacterium]|jgi:UTP--glucose-1-phosphate uridylyltransferase|nr:UTP--glucose-1-phosphate uridylyltransferase [Clostridiales bacterium]